MIGKLKRLMSELGAAAAEDPGSDEHALRVATAALLVEMARADQGGSAVERDRIQRLLEDHYRLEAGEAKALIAAADRRADHAVSLHEFTAMLHESLDESEKRKVVAMLIRTALADGHFDAHEQHLLGKVADLLYLRRSDYVMLRARILEEEGAGGGTDGG
jgi:uncharacterized tellurite resistance protein B-like protein